MKSVRTLVRDPTWTIDPVRDCRMVEWDALAIKTEVRRRFLDQIIVQARWTEDIDELRALKVRCEKAREIYSGRKLEDLEGIIGWLTNRIETGD